MISVPLLVHQQNLFQSYTNEQSFDLQKMQQQAKIEDSGFCPSFSCYSSDNLSSMAAAKVSSEELADQFHEFGEVDEVDFDFQFSLDFGNEEVLGKEIDSRGQTVFPVFNRDLLGKDELDIEVKSKDDVSDSSSNPLRKLFMDDRDESSSSESDELESIASGTYCVWRPKAVAGSSPLITKCKKSSSTGSGSKTWRIRDLLRRSNSEGREPIVFVTPKKIESPKQKRNSGDVTGVAGRLKAQSPSIHERFYMQKRAQNEDGKKKSFLPYRKDLIGFFANANGVGKMLPF